MIRGTEAEFNFTLPCNYSDLEGGGLVDIVFWQDGFGGILSYGTLPITKTLDDCSAGDKPNQLRIKLMKTETLRFTPERKAYTQLTGVTNTGRPIACKKQIITIYPIYNDSIAKEPLPAPNDDGWVYLDGQIIDLSVASDDWIYLDGQIVE